ncbi:uncharacterized protein [Cebidichthys violaceus]|uniref:uncharacterized protein n=1 Tax=Cebidichthys violaceus TaxID=271503 RepID=UPI0035CC0DE0
MTSQIRSDLSRYYERKPQHDGPRPHVKKGSDFSTQLKDFPAIEAVDPPDILLPKKTNESIQSIEAYNFFCQRLCARSRLQCAFTIAVVWFSPGFLLYNIRRIRPFLTDETAQVLIQALVISRLDYCNSLLTGAPASAIRPLELVQKAAARLVFNRPKFSHTTSFLRSLHWLPVRARIQFKTLVLAYRAVKGTAPSYLQATVKPYTPARPLRSAASGRLVAPSLRGPGGRSTRSWLFSVLAPQWWNELPTDVRTAESLPIFRRRLKTHLFRKCYPEPST